MASVSTSMSAAVAPREGMAARSVDGSSECEKRLPDARASTVDAACRVCDAANGPAARFCSCGTKLEAVAPAREVRKTVTVLFADVTGSTALGEQLDPGAIRRADRASLLRAHQPGDRRQLLAQDRRSPRRPGARLTHGAHNEPPVGAKYALNMHACPKRSLAA
jgi:hypothetical protein